MNVSHMDNSLSSVFLETNISFPLKNYIFTVVLYQQYLMWHQMFDLIYLQ